MVRISLGINLRVLEAEGHLTTSELRKPETSIGYVTRNNQLKESICNINKISLNLVHWYRANCNVMLSPYMALYCVNSRSRICDQEVVSELVINVILINS